MQVAIGVGLGVLFHLPSSVWKGKKITLQTGKYCRYGTIGPESKYFTDVGVSPEQISLHPFNDGKLIEITVIKPIPDVTRSIAAQYLLWNGIGGDVQYLPQETLVELLELGFIIF